MGQLEESECSSGLTCMATGKSFWASGGKNTSTAFFGKGWLPVGGVPTSMMCNCGGGTKKNKKTVEIHTNKECFLQLTTDVSQSPSLQPGLWQRSRTGSTPLCCRRSWTGQSWLHGLQWAGKPSCRQSTAAWLPPPGFAEKGNKTYNATHEECRYKIALCRNADITSPGRRCQLAGATSAWHQCDSWWFGSLPGWSVGRRLSQAVSRPPCSSGTQRCQSQVQRCSGRSTSRTSRRPSWCAPSSCSSFQC